ncbi:MAG: ribosome small subunit-dependent GTPase A [Proteobacteria bacterium]|nr:ribosome small subunit-dependent GTPase A [Pseudomonadota bacterium]
MTDSLSARVVAAFGRHLAVRTADGRTLAARPLGRSLSIVCGDEVRCRLDPQHEELHVTEVLPRATALYRSNLRGAAEPVVANLRELLVVLAPLPAPDYFVLDRYLAAATAAGIGGHLVLNKSDLGIDADVRAELAVYLAAGYPCVEVSADSGAGLPQLLAAIAPGTLAALVGQSGVGKSSLVARLVPAAQIAVGALVREEEGRHTTTAARLYELPGDAGLIDSPGVRDFAPAIQMLDERTLGFVEVARLAPGCRFGDCRHMREPGCAVRSAAEDGSLWPRRYESYRRLRRLYEDLSAARGPQRQR